MTRSAPLDILCVTDYLSDGGGAERLLTNIERDLGCARYRFHNLVLYEAPLGINEEIRAAGHTIEHASIPPQPLKILRARSRLATVTASRRFAAVWAHLTDSQLAAASIAVMGDFPPIIATLHTYPRGDMTNWKESLKLSLTISALKNCKATLVAVSTSMATTYAQRFGLPLPAVISNGIPPAEPPLTFYERRQIRGNLGASEADFLILIPGRLVEQKGHAVAIHALAELKAKYSWTPILVSPDYGPLRGVIEDLSSSLGVRSQLRLIPRSPNPEFLRLIRVADAVIMPSLWEPFGLAAAESMLRGIPTILSKIGGLADIAGDSGGAFLIPPNEPSALASGLNRIRTEPALRAELSAKGAARIKDRFLIDLCSSSYAALIDSLCQRGIK